MKKLISSIVLCLSLMSFNSTNLNYNNVENLNIGTQQKINKKSTITILIQFLTI